MRLNYIFLLHSFFIVFPSFVITQVERQELNESVSLDEIVDRVNHLNTSWKAAKNEKLLNYFDKYRTLRILPIENESLPILRTVQTGKLPPSFDARSGWPLCKDIINRVRTQGACGSCWAVNSASVISDRVCIASRGTKQFHASAEDIIACCLSCIGYQDNVCGGGYGARAFSHWQRAGVVSGGEVNSIEGCKPYSLETYNGRKSLPCLARCTNPRYRKPYRADKVYGRKPYRLPPGAERDIMYHIYHYGPMMALVVAYEDLLIYKQGIYEQTSNKKVTNHFVKLIGWGVEKNRPYWLAVNSWGVQWGTGGFFKILKGKNHCDIESEVSAGFYAAARDSSKFSEARLDKPLHKMFLFTFCVILLMRK